MIISENDIKSFEQIRNIMERQQKIKNEEKNLKNKKNSISSRSSSKNKFSYNRYIHNCKNIKDYNQYYQGLINAYYGQNESNTNDKK